MLHDTEITDNIYQHLQSEYEHTCSLAVLTVKRMDSIVKTDGNAGYVCSELKCICHDLLLPCHTQVVYALTFMSGEKP